MVSPFYSFSRAAFIIVFAIGHVQSSIAQNKRIDSLIYVLKSAKEDTNRVNILNELGKSYWRTEQHSDSRKCLDNAMILAKRIDFKKGIAEAYLNMGNVVNSLGNYPEALKNYVGALKIQELLKNKDGVAVAYCNVGTVYDEQGDFPLALKNYFTSLMLFEEMGAKLKVATVYLNIGYTYAEMGTYPEALKNCLISLRIAEGMSEKNIMSGCYNNIGIIYESLGNYDEALRYQMSSLKIRQEQGSKSGVAGCYANIANLYRKQKRYKEALKTHLASLGIKKELGDKYGIAESYHNIGALYVDQTIYPEALKNYNTSLEIGKEIGDKRVIAHNLIALGILNLSMNKLADARRYLNNGLALSSEIGLTGSIRDAYRSLTELDSTEENFMGAYAHHKMYIFYRDSLMNEENAGKIVRQQMQFDFSRIEDSLKSKQVLMSEQLKRQVLMTGRQRMTKNILIAGFFLFIGFSFFAYTHYRTRQQLKLQTLRNRIASDLHDDVGSTLSSISIFSQMAQEQSKEVIPALNTIGESSRKMLDAMADIVWTINPENDQFEKIVMRMRSFAYELLGAKRIEFRFVADDDVSKINLSMEARKNLYLIFKEATNNLVKYAEASRAVFTLKKEGDQLTMMIRDNGKGFNAETSAGGNGLKNMRKRALEIGADLVIDSVAGTGTTIRLQLAV